MDSTQINNSNTLEALDCINRQAAIDKINERQRKLIYCFGFENDAVKIMDIVKSIITAMPPVQPERIKGHWIEITSRNHTYKCSVCGRLLVNITDGKNNVAKNYPYCHCGADMRGEAE